MNHESGCSHVNCSHSNTNKSVCQTLSEMDWERGIWNAAFNGETDKVQSIIDKARNIKEAVDAPDNGGYTALHYAARKGHLDICTLLLNNGANINAQTNGKATPLHKAAVAGNLSTIQWLLQSGAKADLQDVDGQTALHKVIENKHFDLITVFLEACPQLAHIKDNKGKLAIEPISF